MIFGSPLKAMVKMKYLSLITGKKLSETALCSVNSSHRVTAFPSSSLSIRMFLLNLQSDIWMPLEDYGEKGNILR